MDPLYIFTLLCLCAAAADGLARTRVGRPIGGAILVILLAAVLANVGVIPTAGQPVPLYGQVLSIGAPVSIFWLLLQVRLTTLRRAGAPMLGLFALGSLGTVVGVVVAGRVTGAAGWLGEWYGPLTGMYVATYVGGGANFNALASHYGFFETGNLFAAATVADHVLTTAWIAALLVIPRLLPARLRTGRDGEGDVAPRAPDARDDLDPRSLPVLVALGVGAHWLSLQLGAWSASLGLAMPPILILTTLALVAAQVPAVARLRGTQTLGIYGCYLFLAVLGAYCEVAAVLELGRLGLLLLLFVTLAVAIHGLILFGGGLVLRQPPELIAVASATNIGGSTVVLPLVQSLGRRDLLLPGVLVGALGNALGTYLGFLLVRSVS